MPVKKSKLSILSAKITRFQKEIDGLSVRISNIESKAAILFSWLQKLKDQGEDEFVQRQLLKKPLGLNYKNGRQGERKPKLKKGK